ELLVRETDLVPAFLLPVALCEAAMLALRGLINRELARPLGARLGVREAFELSTWTTVANHLAPLVGGTGMRALYLKRVHRLPYSHFFGLQAATYVLHFALAAAGGLAAIALLDLPEGTPAGPLAAAFAVVGVGGLAAVALAGRLPRPRSLAGLAGVAGRVREGIERLGSVRRGRLLLWLALNLAASAGSIFASFALLAAPLGAAGALLVAALVAFAVLLSVTPAAFGVTEGIVVLAAGLVGVPAPVALAAAAAKRLVAVGVIALAAAGHALARRR
ncbi:MAG TPA: lysylphosphatidylglycerol synthase domain-containing protein, partial [Thermoanaerobaculia bacterium]|nr:lysylphosphatidylglycerol synthase domain-containing protein [Thermoanaerobaculia bacterium]